MQLCAYADVCVTSIMSRHAACTRLPTPAPHMRVSTSQPMLEGSTSNCFPLSLTLQDAALICHMHMVPYLSSSQCPLSKVQQRPGYTTGTRQTAPRCRRTSQACPVLPLRPLHLHAALLHAPAKTQSTLREKGITTCEGHEVQGCGRKQASFDCHLNVMCHSTVTLAVDTSASSRRPTLRFANEHRRQWLH